jgi:aspartyl-tRNA(Asn)/glutamyl-tRNA(Gln) amidotransferase subunit C
VKITEDEVRYVAALANLSLTEEEVGKLRSDLDGILGLMDQLNTVDVEGVEPMTQVLFGESDTLREDVIQPPLGNEAALANAPQSGAGYFKVPKVIER